MYFEFNAYNQYGFILTNFSNKNIDCIPPFSWRINAMIFSPNSADSMPAA